MKVLIAGASGGIGRFLAEQLSTYHEVCGSYNTRKPEGQLAYDMHHVDVTNEYEVEAWIERNCSEADELVLIYCVGVNYNCMMHKSESDKWKAVVDSNLNGVQHVLRYLLTYMRKKGFGRVILLSSVVPKIGVSGTSAYAASKSALWGLSKAVAKENATYGITINTINLGYFDLGMIKDVPADILEKIVAEIPMGKLGKPVNVLRAVEFFMFADYITGSELNLNGGLL